MKPEKSYRRILITDCSLNNSDFLLLFQIFRSTLKPDMHFREFKAYFSSAKLDYIDVTFVFINQVLAGFCSAAFYHAVINHSGYTIGRAATGILPQHRGSTLPKWKLYKKYIRYWLRHPLCPFLLSAYVANPLIYAMICKYTGIAFPRETPAPPQYVMSIKQELLCSQNLLHKEHAPFVVEIHFCVALDAVEQERIFKSTNKHVQYYLKINPHFRNQFGVLVIIPVNLKNISLTSARFTYYTVHKWLQKYISHNCTWYLPNSNPDFT